MTFREALDLFGDIASTFTSIGTLIILYYTSKLAKESKQADLLMDFNRRFEALCAFKNSADGQKDPEQFWDRFWNLQFDQFTHWRQGFVNDHTFKYWMTCRHKDYSNLKYEKAWESRKHTWRGTDFAKFMQCVHDESFEAACEAVPKKA
jgi:hypothetical protein